MTWALHYTDAFAWMSSQPHASVHGVVTDPPFALREYAEGAAVGKGAWRVPPTLDGKVRAPVPRFSDLSMSELVDLRAFNHRLALALLTLLVPGGHVIVASTPLLAPVLWAAFHAEGFENRGALIRLVTTLRGGDRPKGAHLTYPEVCVLPRAGWEPWLLFRKPCEGRVRDNLAKYGTGGLRAPGPGRDLRDVIPSAPASPRERALAPHPSLKPQAFLRQVVRAVLPLGTGTVYDPFAGSGSTLAAAEHLGYTSVGTERDPGYYALALDAIPKLAAFTP